MTSNRTFKHTNKQYIKQIPHVQENANLENHAKTQIQSESGVKSSGKHSQTHLQYGHTNFSESATSQNGGASVINIR